MNRVAFTAVRQFLVDRYSSRLAAKDAGADLLPDDYDLLRQGIIDSLGVLEMVGAVEAEFGIELDLEDLDAEDLTKIGPFCRHVERLSQRLINARSGSSSPNGADDSQ
jgi:acyl carrier protein